jgi:hypothetical protein
MTKPRLLIIGHGRHGKDTVAEVLRDYHGFKFISSSYFCAGFVAERMGYGGANPIATAYAERHMHRREWATLIKEYNTPDKTRTANEMLAQGYDMYVGMRQRDELEACKAAGLFDAIIWVDRSDHLPDEPASSMDLNWKDADWVIGNNGTLRDLWINVDDFIGDVL